MPRHLEMLSGGLNTARDPAMLSPSELCSLENCVYAPGTFALRRATGRSPFGRIDNSAAAINGLRDLRFDNGDHFLLALRGTLLATARVGDTGTFASTTNFTAATGLDSFYFNNAGLDAIHFQDEWLLLTGGNPLSIYISATASGQHTRTRIHGLQPVTSQVGITTATGTWTAGSIGYFEYWSTEVFEYTKNGILTPLESTYTGSPASLYVSATGMQATLTIPAPVNSLATRWKLYRSTPGMELATDTSFPAGFLIAEGAFATGNTSIDGGATVGAYQSANATAAGTITQFANPANVFSSDNLSASHTGVAYGELIVAFPTFTVIEPILGLELALEGRLSGVIACQVSISNDGGLTYGPARTAPFVFSATDTTFPMGGASDKWGLNWTTVGVSTTKLRVKLVANDIFTINPNGSLFVDHIRARFTYAGTAATTEDPFPAVVIEIDGEDASIGSHGPVPVATTGDLFQGALVLGGIPAEPALTRHSLAGQPDYFPAIYFIDFETASNDRVTNVKTLNNRLGVFLAERLWRVNYLPTEADANFSRGICKEEVSSELGCVNAMCATTYTGPTGHTEIAFVSNVGIHSTDLFTVRDLIPNVNWRQLIDLSVADSRPIALINDTEHNELLFYYLTGTATFERHRCLHLSYDTLHVRGGSLKVSGPVNLRNFDAATSASGDLYSAWPVTRSNGDTSIYLGYGATAGSTAAGAGGVYRETGDVIPSLNNLMSFTTRRMFLPTLGAEFELGELYTYITTAETSGTHPLSVTPATLKTNDPAGLVTQSAKTHTLTNEGQFKLQFNQIAEGLQLTFAQTATASANSPLSIEYIAFNYTHDGDEDSGL